MGGIYQMIRELEKITTDIREEANKFDRGNMSAGTRVTKGLQEIKKQAQAIRMQVFETKKKNK